MVVVSDEFATSPIFPDDLCMGEREKNNNKLAQIITKLHRN
jgi:hypothetical protein